ncbi:MAG: hypothetical protein A2W93_03110 [Bacteroidetes bacterium GWF2_43_63]|nr:MAG: hypothetical protein A2W93_03110 [Bacteroidetes bacterium GWF2_43_63]HBG71006.1 hypothetical protein [Bacteroidales bacterium]
MVSGKINGQLQPDITRRFAPQTRYPDRASPRARTNTSCLNMLYGKMFRAWKINVLLKYKIAEFKSQMATKFVLLIDFCSGH